jgi:N-acyl-D-aspartate/D-glutamate deacylase
MGQPSGLLISGAMLYDGSGEPPRRADVRVEADRITAVAEPGALEGASALDARGLALAPGFIDVHTHDDFAAVLHPEMGFKVQGGVTTCVVGNCGFGAAPWSSASLMARAFHPHDTLPEWKGYGGYLDHLDAEPPSVNVGALVGHGTLRLTAMGTAARAPSKGELTAMKADVREGLEAGALGFSTGLVYEPGRHADTSEIVALAAEMRDTGALYATHMRNEGPRLLDSVREAIEIGERAGLPVQISHHKAAGREAWGLVRESLQLIEEARARGLDVHADQYPYTAGSTVLAAVVQNQGFRPRSGSGLGAVEPSSVVIASTASHPEWEGQSIEQLMASFDLPAQEAAEHVLIEEPGATCVMHSMDEDDVRTVMRHPTTMIGSDGIPTLGGKPHPRLYGTFARVLGRYARELGLFPLEEAVHRMTGLPAAKFGLEGRGGVREGAFADLVLFDPDTILDVGTFEDPNRHPAGIVHVLVNGTPVVRDGEHTGARPGRALRRMRA